MAFLIRHLRDSVPRRSTNAEMEADSNNPPEKNGEGGGRGAMQERGCSEGTSADRREMDRDDNR
jgi:hypothetical protein